MLEEEGLRFVLLIVSFECLRCPEISLDLLILVVGLVQISLELILEVVDVLVQLEVYQFDLLALFVRKWGVKRMIRMIDTELLYTAGQVVSFKTLRQVVQWLGSSAA